MLLFFLVALLYSTVGHGGASGYLALFALFGIVDPRIAPIALILNILVAGTAFLVYRQYGHFRLNLLLPFALSSVPLAFLGGYFPTPGRTFAIILGSVLLLSCIRILFLNNLKPVKGLKHPRHLAAERRLGFQFHR